MHHHVRINPEHMKHCHSYHRTYATRGHHWASIVTVHAHLTCRSMSDPTRKKTRYTDPMLVQCWASVAAGGPALNQHWVSVSCWLGYVSKSRDLERRQSMREFPSVQFGDGMSWFSCRFNSNKTNEYNLSWVDLVWTAVFSGLIFTIIFTHVCAPKLLDLILTLLRLLHDQMRFTSSNCRL